MIHLCRHAELNPKFGRHMQQAAAIRSIKQQEEPAAAASAACIPPPPCIFIHKNFKKPRGFKRDISTFVNRSSVPN